jgi:hypothetical protein
LTFDRRWQSAMSADAHGRAIWGLSIAATEARQPHVRAGSLALLARLAPPRDVSLRPGVYAALGAARLLETIPDNVLANQIVDGVAGTLPAIRDHSGWLWPEERLTYDNARIPECYLALGEVTGNEHLCGDGLRLLEWLAEIERHGDHFSFTPATGRGPTDRSPLFDQQPLEATAMVDACLTAWRITAESRWFEHATAAVAWFAGLNDTSTPLYDPHTGAGYDGLNQSGININAGAESTVSVLWALEQAIARGLGPVGIVSKGPAYRGVRVAK